MLSEETEVKVTTYGIKPEILDKLITAVYVNLVYRLTRLAEEIDEENRKLLEILIQQPLQARLLIAGSIIFAVGNFSRIDKIELTGTIDILKPGEIISIKEATRPGVA